MFACFTHQLVSSRWLSRRFFLAWTILLLLSGNSLAGSVNLAWDAVPGPNLGGYKLYYGPNSRNYPWSVDVGNQTTYTLSGLQDGAPLYFAVTAYDAARTTESGYSNEVSATVAAADGVAATPPQASPPSSGGGGTSGGTASGNGLVAAYGFEEASGATVADVSGNGNYGTIYQAVRTSRGRFGKALKFDGVNDWVTVNPSSSLDLTGGMTLEAWVRPTVWMSSWQGVVMKEQAGSLAYCLLANNSANQPEAGVSVDGVDGVQAISGVTQLPPSTWTHLAATYDGEYQRLYINGSEVAVQQQSGAIQTSTGALRIGGNSIWGEFFQGYIDEVRIYNRPLSHAEIDTDSQRAVGS